MMYFKASFLLAVFLPSTVSAEGATFSYVPSKSNGPESWPTLDLGDKVNVCDGDAQSGIDVLTGLCDETDADYIFEPGNCTLAQLTYTVTDHNIGASYDASICEPPRMMIPGVDTPFVALQFHIHTGSDHAVDGTYFGADMHIVHQEVGGSGLAVLGIFMEPSNNEETGKVSDLLAGWEAVATATNEKCFPDDSATTQSSGNRKLKQEQQGRKLQPDEPFSPYSLVPQDASYYFYAGGLTTPPCSEIVTWNVVDTAASLSVKDFVTMTSLILDYVDPATCEFATVASPLSGFTGRPLQPLNGRAVTHKCPAGTEARFPTSSAASYSLAATAILSMAMAAWVM